MYLFETCTCISFPFSYHKIKKKTKIGGQRWQVETDEKDQEGTWGRYEKLLLINGYIHANHRPLSSKRK